MTRAAPCAGRALLMVLLIVAGGAPACAHDDVPEKAAATTSEPAPPDRLESALAPFESDDEDLPVASGTSAPHPGKVERLQERNRVSRYETVTGRGGGDDPGESQDDGLIRMESESYGTPGLVLVRAMGGAQKVGYTILEMDERDYYFIALRTPSILQGFIGGTRGACKIAVGTEAQPGSELTKIVLKGRAGTAGARPVCEKDLEKILRYGRGEISDRPDRREREKPPWMRDVQP